MNFENKDKAHEDSIIEFEKKFNIELPDIYRDFLKNQNGGRLDGSYTYADDEGVVDSFFGIKTKSRNLNLDIEYQDLQEILPKSYLPIATDSGGNYYLIKLNIKKAPVYFWDHNLQTEGTKAIGLERIANSFGDFVDSIKLYTTEIEVTVIVGDDYITLE